MFLKMSFFKKITIYTFCFILIPCFVFAKDTITWMKYVWPPVYIADGPYKDQGNADAILQFFQEQLTEYEHKTRRVNPARAIQSMKDGEKVCMVGTLKTAERMKFLYFAIPIGITLPNAVIVKQSSLPHFGNKEMVSLEDLLKNKKLKGGIIKERSYTPAIDSVTNKYKEEDNLYVLSTGKMADPLFKMLIMDRLDYIIEYPWVAVFLERTAGKKDIITSIGIKEMAPFSFGRMAAPKNEWGKKIVTRINEILTKARPTPQYREFVERWNDEKSLARIRKGYDEIFIHKYD